MPPGLAQASSRITARRLAPSDATNLSVAAGRAFQAAMAPSSVAHRNSAAVPAPLNGKSVVDGFDVIPAGTPWPCHPLPVSRRATAKLLVVPAPLYRVDTPVPFSATPKGLVALAAMPRPLMSVGLGGDTRDVGHERSHLIAAGKHTAARGYSPARAS